MTDPILAAEAAALTVGRWGVYDLHTREWAVAPDLPYERAAWQSLLAVNSPHPWELADRQADTTTPGADVTCPDCHGDGVCEACYRDCARCDGDGEIAATDLTEYERRRLERKSA